MFDFLFKRKPKATSSSANSNLAAANAASLASVAKADQQQQIAQARAAALAKLESLASNPGAEDAIVSLLLSCDFADGRFKAANHVHSAAALQKVLSAMRNTDKRVAKLMQARLDVLAQADQQQQLALRCINQAQQLGLQASLNPQQIADLDKLVAGLKHFPDALKAEFDAHYTILQTRLQAQTALQRQVLDLVQHLTISQGIADDAHGAQLDIWQQAFDLCLQQAEAVALPKNLLADFTHKMQAAREQWAQLQKQKIADAKTYISAPVSAPVATTIESSTEFVAAETSDSVDVAPANAMHTDPTSTEKPAQITTPSSKAKPVKLVQVSTEQILAAIQDMEAALEQGSALLAQKLEREVLRGVDLKHTGLNAEQKERLFKVQSELGRLLSWAKWGGSISRDELIKAAEELPSKELEPDNLAKKVSGLRERWKSLEASTGGAAREIWDRFDTACNLAYAPAAAYFQQLAEERKVNLEKAELQLSEWRITADALLQTIQTAPDWKVISQTAMQMKQTWQTLSAVDRKNKARVDGQFYAIYQSLSQPLEQQRKAEVASREQLIAQVAALDPQQRDSVDQLRALQARWQEQAQALPLRRKDEQALWEKFRAACDGLFAQRKAVSDSADAERKANLQAKQTLCTSLERAPSADALSESAIKQLLQEAANTWRSIGYVPRGEENEIDRRYENAVAQLKRLLQQAHDEKSQAGKKLLQAKLRLCQQLEAAFVEDTSKAQTLMSQLSAEWQQLSSQATLTAKPSTKLPGKLDSELDKRFAAISQAVQNSDASYANLLQKNADSAAQSILQLEILNSIDSPPELARTRLQIQVDVLQAALRSGNNADAAKEQLHRLCSLPVLLDQTQRQRLDKLLMLNLT
ncbi:exonuclease SbcC [Undibacterium sp. GrIS 1.2]|uniref:DUF349 domain-containing protein n=1 Tax=Undibacterium sp. GrIS 1.2 TaxID=3143933 RepID=UPI0033954568